MGLTRRPVFLALVHTILVGGHRGRFDGVPVGRVELMNGVSNVWTSQGMRLTP